jgi:hypothetical protein
MLKLDPDYIRRILRQNTHEGLRLVKPSEWQAPQELPSIALRLAS